MFPKCNFSPLESHIVYPTPNHDDRTRNNPFFLLKPSFRARNMTEAREWVRSSGPCAVQEEQQTECLHAQATPYPLEWQAFYCLRVADRMSALERPDVRSSGQSSCCPGLLPEGLSVRAARCPLEWVVISAARKWTFLPSFSPSQNYFSCM